MSITIDRAELQAGARREIERRRRMMEQKEEAERDLLAFVRMFWRTLEPEKPLVEGWLLDCLCLPYEAEIVTETGPMAIGRYVETRCAAKVLSFNHSTLLPEWRNVQARRKSGGKPLVTLMLCDTILSVTDDHPVFVKGRGYVAASEIRPGETVLRLHELRNDVPASYLQRSEIEESVLQQGVPLRACDKTGQGAQASELPDLRRDIFSGSAGHDLLQSDMRRQGAPNPGCTQMPDLRRFQGMGRRSMSRLLEAIKQAATKAVRGVWKAGSETICPFLWRGMLLQDEPRSSPPFVHTWRMDKEISSGVLANTLRDTQKGWQTVPFVPQLREPAHSSHRQGTNEQREMESGHALPRLPHEAAQQGGSYFVGESDVLSVEREARIPGEVYNIAVEGNNNYFAAGILVHNCDTLMAISDGHLTRICINVPPGSGKSSLLNCFFPAWEWGPQDQAHLRYLSISYSTAVPERDNIRFARIINDPVYQRCWGDRVKLVREGAEIVENNRTGWKRVTSTGGSVTGFRGDRILIDDANNPMNVESEDVRGSTNRFIREIMPSRLNSLAESAIINLQQRTHEDDATGTLIKHGQDFVFVSIPMEFDPLRIFPVTLRPGFENDDGEWVPPQVWTDPRALDSSGRMLRGLTTNARGEPRVEMGSPMAAAEGALCWPDLFPPDEVAKQKARIGPYGWDSQFNQIPGVRGGSIIRRDWWRLWPSDEYPEMGTRIVSIDTAIEEGANNDFNAVTCWGAFAGPEGEPQLLLTDAWRARLPLAQLVDRVARTCRQQACDFLLIEHKTRGRDLHDEIVRLYADAPWQTVLIKVETSKIARLKAVEHLFSGDYRKDVTTGIEVYEGGMVFAPDKDFAEEVIAEVGSFPYGSHDDYVDTVSMALGFVRKTGIVLRKVEHDADEIARRTYRKPAVLPYSIRGV